MEWWTGALCIAGGVIAIPAGLVVFRKNRWTGGLLVLGGLAVLGVLAPSMYADEPWVDADHFEARYGFWWSPTRHNIRFDDLREIQIVAKTKMTRRGKQTSYELHCAKKSGGTEIVHVGTIMGEAGGEILDRAEEKGVPIHDLTGGQ